jgi:hypothetical protein
MENEKVFAIVALLSMLSFVFCLALIKKVYFDKKKEATEKDPHELTKKIESDADLSAEYFTESLRRSSPYQVMIKNTTDKDLLCTLFGFGQNILTKNFGSDDGIEVIPSQSNVTYLELLCQSAFKPFETSLIIIQSKNINQISKIITITSKDANGQLCQIPLITQSYLDPKELLKVETETKEVEIPYGVTIDCNTNLQLSVLANTELVFTMFYNITRLFGDNDIKVNYAKPNYIKNK